VREHSEQIMVVNSDRDEWIIVRIGQS